MLNLKTVEASVSIAQTSSVAAVHESAIGTELPIPNVRSSVANGQDMLNASSWHFDPEQTSARFTTIQISPQDFPSLRVAGYGVESGREESVMSGCPASQGRIAGYRISNGQSASIRAFSQPPGLLKN